MEVELQLIIVLLSFYSTRHMIDIIQHAYSFLLKNSLNIWKLLNFRVSLQKNKTYQDKGIKTYPCKGIKKCV